MNNDIFDLIKDIDISYVQVAGFKDDHYIKINLNKDDLKKFETQYYHFFINKVDELRAIKQSLEADVQSLINTVGELARENDELKKIHKEG